MTLRWIRSFHRFRNCSDVGLIEVRARERCHYRKKIAVAFPFSHNALAATCRARSRGRLLRGILSKGGLTQGILRLTGRSKRPRYRGNVVVAAPGKLLLQYRSRSIGAT